MTMHNGYFSSSPSVEASDFESDDIPNDAKAIEKDAALRVALSQLAGDFGKESMLSLQRFFHSRRPPVISTGSLRLDLALGIGGLPKGRIVEIFGQEASGKTTLALHVIEEAQKLRGYCAYLDVENAMNPTLAESIGVNTDNLLISQPDSAENLLSMVDTLTKSGSIDVIVVDSVAALIPQLEIDNMEVRANLKSAKGYRLADQVTCGKNALPFYAAVRMKLIRKTLCETQDKATGLGVCVKVIKNKLAPAMTNAELTIKFGRRGICYEPEILELTCEHGIILKEGGSYFIEGETLNTKEEAIDYLAANDNILDRIVKNLRCQLFERKSKPK